MNRKIVVDTETTGLNAETGDRIVEIGAVELIDNVETGKTFHVYINPKRNMPEEAFNVHKLSEEFLSDKPLFKDVVDDFIAFIKGGELLMHNAKFDIGFLNKEFDRAGRGKLWDHVSNVIDTLDLSKRLFSVIPAGEVKGHKLDNMCARFGIDTSERQTNGHGALIDSKLLAKCYIRINELHSKEDIEADLEQTNWERPPIKRYQGVVLPEITLSAREEVQHVEFLAKLADKNKVTPIFNNIGVNLAVNKVKPL